MASREIDNPSYRIVLGTYDADAAKSFGKVSCLGRDPNGKDSELGLVQFYRPSKWDWRYWLARYRYWKAPEAEKQKLREMVEVLKKSW